MRRVARARWRRSAGALLAALAVGVPSLPAAAAAEEDGAAFDTGGGSRARDPWEPVNRRIFRFNETVDIYVLEPVAEGWDWLLPDFALRGVDNFFENAAAPGRLVNDLLQGKPAKFGDDLGRFLVNTIFGLGGLFDPASAMELPSGEEDFGQTLAVWGVPAGPYLVLPLFGPSNPRDTAGFAVDSGIASPFFYLVPLSVNAGLWTVDFVNERTLLLEEIAAERRAAFDFYAAVRNASVSLRRNQVHDRTVEPEEDDEDLYYFDEDE